MTTFHKVLFNQTNRMFQNISELLFAMNMGLDLTKDKDKIFYAAIIRAKAEIHRVNHDLYKAMVEWEQDDLLEGME